MEEAQANAQSPATAGQAPPIAQSAPQISLPKGGGAVRGMGEKFAANPVTGTGSMTVPIATSPGRSGFGPQLSLSYDSGAGNGPFGFGWSLSLPVVARKTDKGLPQYVDTEESDVFILSGAEDLVPAYRQDPHGTWVAGHPGFQRDASESWVRDAAGRLVLHEDEIDGYRVRRYRPRVEGLFARIERWSRIGAPHDVHWRSISKDNILTLYGHDADSRIADPLDATRIFSWLISESRDDKGNGIRYLYKKEDGAYQPRSGQPDPFKHAHQLNRGLASDPRRSAQRYLQRVLYGNLKPLLDIHGQRPRYLNDLPSPPTDTGADWLFEVRFDYGELDAGDPTGKPEKPWFYRHDAFSSYRSGFELRTCRRCEQVLMLHHIPDQPEAPGRSAQRGYTGVVRSTEFVYDDELDPNSPTQPVYSFLRQVVQWGWKQADGVITRRSLPPVELEYTRPVVQDELHDVDPASLENLPIGVDGSAYQWTDLHGEGIPGILTEQAGAWYYKRNLSPRGNKPVEFAPLEFVATKPNLALAGNAVEFMDLAGDGLPDLVVLDGPIPGLCEHDEGEGWQRFRPFTSRLNRDMRDPNLKFVDLDGDGYADVLISEDDAFVWHSSLAEEGFGPARRVTQALDEEKGPRIVFADGTQSIYLADLSGDGLTDLVRIRNGAVCYWPNLGYGRFGAKVAMDNAPWFDNPDQFDQKRIRLADIDGSGTTDIIYLHREGVRLYFNQSGNSWSKPRQLMAIPRIDDAASIVPTDLLGNGTACLVWSSPWPGDARRPMRYVKLMGDIKPHLLFKTRNNLGAETHVDYAPSTKFYLRDKRDAKPWVTRLPFPVHVVERVTTYDHISRNRFITRYAYHHGYFDGEEREFRGFGMVEQWDTENFTALSDGNAPADNIDAASHVPAVHTKTWFHTGAYLGYDHLSNYFAGLLNATDPGEYFREPGLTDAEVRALLLPDTVLPAGLSLEEEREACRALKGSMLRQEVYADDAEDDPSAEQIAPTGTPYTVTEQNFSIRALQPRAGNRHAVFFAHACEAISYNYERNPADPRVQHALTLEVDAYGNVLKQAAIGCGRREEVRSIDAQGQVHRVPNPGLAALAAVDQAKQTKALVTYTENRVTNAIELPDTHRTPLPCEAVTFELTDYPPTGAAGRHRAADLVERDTAGQLRLKGTDQVDYEAAPTGNRCRRPIEWLRTLFRRDVLKGPLTDLLPLGQVEPLALPGESYKLAFTPGLLAQVFQRGQPTEPLLPPLSALSVLGDEGGYLQGRRFKNAGLFFACDADDHWWLPSGRSYFNTDPAEDELASARQGFFLPRRYRDPFGQDVFVKFDAHHLLMAETRDALGNCVTVDVNDYRVLQPRLVSDPNGNQTEVAFDTLGMVVGTAVMGRPPPAPAEGDSLEGFVADPEPEQLGEFVRAPRRASADPNNPDVGEAAPIAHRLLQKATTRIVYDLYRYMDSGEPPLAATIARETHVSDLNTGEQSKLLISFSYSDGFGREIQKKVQAEPGTLVKDGPWFNPRWVGSGWTIFNNKGKPVRQYEPFFSATHGFQFDAKVGVSHVLFYDPAERVVATLHPNHTYEKVVFDPWQRTTYDVNDTVARFDLATSVATDFSPADDPDVGGFFKRLPGDSYLPTWFNLRTDSAKALAQWPDIDAQGLTRPDNAQRRVSEKKAAEQAAAHADTPTTAHLDALGRPFLTVAHNRVVCADHPLNGKPDEEFRTRVELDIEGNQRQVSDERKLPDASNLPLGPLEQRVVMRYAYDMLGNRMHQFSMEAGARWMLNDVAGKPIRAWDSRGHNFMTRYDALRRPIEQYVRGAFSDPDPLKPNSDPRTLNPPNEAGLLVDKIEYGEPPPGASPAHEEQAQRHNLRTRIFRHFDSAGVATNARLDDNDLPTEAYDFKGNLLRSSRRLARDYIAIPDWLLPAEPQLEAELFEASTRYDALNRAILSVAPHSSLARAQHPDKINVIQPVFNEANLLERVDVWLERAAEPAALLDPADLAMPLSPVGVANIDYDAKGQRQRIDYKNGASTVYSYDPLTFRLTKLLTKRKAVDFPGDDPQPSLADWPGKQVQNLHYTYDPAGNITHIHDDAQQTIYFRNQRVEPSNDYTYDALYRLIQANGREHLGQTNGARNPPTSPDAFNAFHTRLDHPGNGNAMGTYVERYVYDAVGNFRKMQHRGSDPVHAGWTRTYTYDEASLIEPAKQSNRLSRAPLDSEPSLAANDFGYDAHGSMTRLPHLPLMQWDYREQLQATAQQLANIGAPDTTYYVYDASGQRVRKITELAVNTLGAIVGSTHARKAERIYLGGFEIFREYKNDGVTPKLERETLHVMDDKQRIALVETRTAGNDPAPAHLIRYQFGNHLGSVSLELDDQARIVSYEEYTPYGSTSYRGVPRQLELAKRYRYTGKERDEESGLYYHGARYYAAWLGKWVSCDPLGTGDGQNIYAYCHLSPVRKVDFNGMQTTPSQSPLGVSGPYQDLPSDKFTTREHLQPGKSWKALLKQKYQPQFVDTLYDRVYNNMDATKQDNDVARIKTREDNRRTAKIRQDTKAGRQTDTTAEFLQNKANEVEAAKRAGKPLSPADVERVHEGLVRQGATVTKAEEILQQAEAGTPVPKGKLAHRLRATPPVTATPSAAPAAATDTPVITRFTVSPVEAPATSTPPVVQGQEYASIPKKPLVPESPAPTEPVLRTGSKPKGSMGARPGYLGLSFAENESDLFVAVLGMVVMSAFPMASAVAMGSFVVGALIGERDNSVPSNSLQPQSDELTQHERRDR